MVSLTSATNKTTLTFVDARLNETYFGLAALKGGEKKRTPGPHFEGSNLKTTSQTQGGCYDKRRREL